MVNRGSVLRGTGLGTFFGRGIRFTFGIVWRIKLDFKKRLLEAGLYTILQILSLMLPRSRLAANTRGLLFASFHLAGIISAVRNVTGPSRPDSSSGESFV